MIRSLAANFSREWLVLSLITVFKSSIGVVDMTLTENGVLSPSMRHQRVYSDILCVIERLEKEEGRGGGCGEGKRLRWLVAIYAYQHVSIKTKICKYVGTVCPGLASRVTGVNGNLRYVSIRLD